MKTKLSALIFLFFLSPYLHAQFVTKLQLTGGGTGSDLFQQISNVVDGNIFIGATSNSTKSHTKSENSKGLNDYWVTKFSINKNGTISKAWDRTIGGSSYDDLETVFATEDGGCLLAGNSNSGISGDKTDTNSSFGFDTWLVKLDKDGNIQWQNTIYSTNYNMKFYDLDGIPGGDFIMVSGAGLTKLDSTGNIIWVQAPQAGHYYISVKHTLDSGFIMADNYARDGLTKADKNGIAQWSNSYGSHISLLPNDKAIQTSDGNYTLYGIDVVDKVDDTYFPLYRNVFKTDATGKLIWSVTDYNEDGYNLQAGLAVTSDGGFLFGTSVAVNGPLTYNVEKINKNGIKLWQANAPGISNDLLAGIARLTPNSYLLGGSTSGLDDDYQVYLVGITDTTVRTVVASNSNAFATKEVEFIIYPNPVKDKINIYSAVNTTYVLQDASGKTIVSQKINGNGSIDISRLQAGIYYIVNTGTGNSYKVLKN